MARYDAAGTAYNPAASGPTEAVSLRWTTSVDDSFYGRAPPILVDGTLFAVGRESIAAFDAETGERRFRRPGSYVSAPAWVGSDVYRTDTLAVTGRGGIFGLNAGGGYEVAGRSIGAERWHAPGRDPPGRRSVVPKQPAPVTVDETVYAAISETGRVVALRGDSGRVEWTHTVRETNAAPPLYRPVVRDGVAYLASPSPSLHAVDAETGASLWERTLDVRHLLQPTATSEGIVVPTGDEVLLVDSADGRTIWTYEHGRSVWGGSVAVADGTIFFTDMCSGICWDGLLRAVDLASGEERWTAGYDYRGSPVVADGVVYLGNPYAVKAFDATTGDRLWSWTGEGRYGLSTPIVGDGVLYVAGDKRIVALEEA